MSNEDQGAPLLGATETAEALRTKPPLPKRKSIQPTYDSRVTGPRYYVTYELDGRVVTSRERLQDPFVRATLKISRWDRLKSLLRRDMEVVVHVGGDRDVVDDVLELNADWLGIGPSTRRDEWDAGLRQAVRRFTNESESHEDARHD